MGKIGLVAGTPAMHPLPALAANQNTGGARDPRRARRQAGAGKAAALKPAPAQPLAATLLADEATMPPLHAQT